MTDDTTFTICVAGDPIHDRYKMGDIYNKTGGPDRFVLNDSFGVAGGAANVADNLLALAGETVRVVELFDADVPWPSLTRYVDNSTDKILFEVEISEPLGTPKSILHKVPSDRTGLVIADYNKGATNAPITVAAYNLLKTKSKFEFIIVDSRYGTYWPGWLEFGRMKILHATGNELDRHDPSLFNYIFQTDGANDIKLLHWGKQVATIPVPDVSSFDVVDCTGAGDTFTACIAIYLAAHCNQAWDTELMIQAAKYAIPLCQNVIQYLGTAVPELEQ
jgi:bifunctional ADP-heptose synthase (sugar kinase/adenylyltransferase)